MDDAEIKNIATRTANSVFGATHISSIANSSSFDSEGNEALNITVTLYPNFVGDLYTRAPLEMAIQTSEALQNAGEWRFPYIRYETGGK